MNLPTDDELVESARKGHVDSFGKLYERYYVTVVGAAYSVLTDRHLAEDAAQEAFAVACRELAGLRRAERFSAWICAIARRVAIRMAKARRERVSSEETAVAVPEFETHVSDAIQQAVSELPARAREVVVLHYFTGLSHQEVARSLGLSLSAVHGRLVRARRILAERLSGNGMGDIEL